MEEASILRGKKQETSERDMKNGQASQFEQSVSSAEEPRSDEQLSGSRLKREAGGGRDDREGISSCVGRLLLSIRS